MSSASNPPSVTDLSHTNIETIHQASEPFNDQRAEIILRSSDDVDFHVFKSILAFVSSVFDNMFSMPSPSCASSNEHMDRIPVIPIAEASATIDKLLRFCYPWADPILESIEEVVCVFRAAEKYDMKLVVGKCKEALAGFAEKNPIGTYTTACALGWEAEAEIAARRSLSQPLLTLLFIEVEDLNTTSATSIQRLWKFHRECATSVVSVAHGDYWCRGQIHARCRSMIYPQGRRAAVCCAVCCAISFTAGTTTYTMTNWLSQYLESVREKLHTTPFPDVTTDQEILDKLIEIAGDCKTCRSHALSKVSIFAKTLADEIEKKILEVKLEFPSPPS